MSEHLATAHRDRVGTSYSCTCGWRSMRLWATDNLAHLEWSDHVKALQDPDDDRYDTDGNPLPYGRCDTCGAPCNRDGCTTNLDHVIGIA